MTGIQMVLSQAEYASLSDQAAADLLNTEVVTYKNSERVTSGILMERMGVSEAVAIVAKLEAMEQFLRTETTDAGRGQHALASAVLEYLHGSGVELASPTIRALIPQFVQQGVLSKEQADRILGWAVQYRSTPSLELLGRVITAKDVAIERTRMALAAELLKQQQIWEARVTKAEQWIGANDGTGTVPELEAILRGE